MSQDATTTVTGDAGESTQPQPLLRPADLGDLRLPNRTIMAPMTRNRAGSGLAPTDLNATYYAQRAGAGLVITEATPVEPRGHGYPNIPGIYTDAQERGWRLVTDAVHRRDGRIFQQLWHSGRINHPLTMPDGERPVAPSAIRPDGSIATSEGEKEFQRPRSLETDEVRNIVQRFGEAAERSRRAGFDGVELHAANGYLVDQFLRDGTNRRTDRYGGDLEGRLRFLREVVDALLEVWGGRRVGVRLSPVSSFNDMSDSDPERTFARAAEVLDGRGIAYLHLVEPESPKPPTSGEHGPAFSAIRDAFAGPLVANGGYDRESGNRVIRDGYADLVSFARSFLANPDLTLRFAEELPLNEPDPESFYGGGAEGYIDYPTWRELQAGSSETGEPDRDTEHDTRHGATLV